MMRSHLLTDQIRIEARSLGFFKAGVAAATTLPWKEHFDAWLARGMQGEMAYLARQAEKRRNPVLAMQDVRSILVLATNYHPGVAIPDNPMRGRISRYALGPDYHAWIMERLHHLLGFIVRLEPAARGLCFVDTGPVMEKVWGACTSVGWMGKHSNLITRDRGSWFFLGVILLNLELEYDIRSKDYCGTCTRCIQACPTGAIIAPFVVDARLCISYLTIELKGAIPRTLRPTIGNRIFGCDDCQEICPWNRFAVLADLHGLQPRPENVAPELVPLATISDEEFAARFDDSPVRRAKRDGFVRNVVIALGNSRMPEAVPALVRCLRDRSTLVRAHAAWSLGEISSPEARIALEQARAGESDPSVLEEIDLALQRPPGAGL